LLLLNATAPFYARGKPILLSPMLDALKGILPGSQGFEAAVINCGDSEIATAVR
jgi:hypothetical protein